MKKILTKLMTVVFAAGFIAFLGCDATADDPDAASNEAGEENINDNEESEEEVGGKGEPNIKPKKKKDPSEEGGPGDDK